MEFVPPSTIISRDIVELRDDSIGQLVGWLYKMAKSVHVCTHEHCGRHTQLRKMPNKVISETKHSIGRFILILVGQILELPKRITAVHFQRSNGHDPDTNQKLKQRLFNNLKAGHTV